MKATIRENITPIGDGNKDIPKYGKDFYLE